MTSEEKSLVDLIKGYATSYYEGTSQVSDEYFDGLVEKLRSINPDSEGLTTGWGYKPRSRKIAHMYGLEIGSLGKIKSVDEIPKDLTDVIRISGKLDGLSVVAYYDKGKLTRALTRGDGRHGLDVTDKIRMISPQLQRFSIDGCPFTGAIRGEVVIPMEVWRRKYRSREIENPSLNPRNIASGYLNRKVLSRDLADEMEYIVYKVIHVESPQDPKIDLHAVLKENNCQVPRKYLMRPQINEDLFKRLYEEWSKSYPCDGLVLSKIDGFSYKEIAYKFEAESKIVTVTDVTYNATRTGRIVPTIWFEPVELSGAIVQKCTGFNARFILDSQVKPGVKIKVQRSGEVIPHITEVVETAGLVDSTLPLVCPRCGRDLVWEGEDLFCENENESQLAYHFITTIAPIEGAGPSLYTEIVRALGLDDVESLSEVLSNLNDDASYMTDLLSTLGRTSTISGSVTWSKVRKIFVLLSQEIDPVRFLVACNIKGLSWKSVETLVDNYPSLLQDISTDSLNEERLYKIKGIGYSVVTSLKNLAPRISKLYKSVHVRSHKIDETRDSFKFKVAITGPLSVKRSDFEEELRKHGIDPSGNFKEIKYLITNSPSSQTKKNIKADELGIEKITEAEFRLIYL